MSGLAVVSGAGPRVPGPQKQPSASPGPPTGQRRIRGLGTDAGQPECGGGAGGVATAQGPHALPAPQVSTHHSGAGRRTSHPQIKLSESTSTRSMTSQPIIIKGSVLGELDGILRKHKGLVFLMSV